MCLVRTIGRQSQISFGLGQMPMLGGTDRTSEYSWRHEGPNDLIAMTGAQDKMARIRAVGERRGAGARRRRGTSFTVPRRASRAEMVAQAVEDRIVEGKLDIGTRLGSRADLGERLGVAPSTVSEAIKLLESRGRVVTRTGPGGGVFVAEPGVRLRLARTMMSVTGSEDEVAEALAVRDLLECAVIIGRPSARTADALLAPMLRALRAMDSATDTAESTGATLTSMLRSPCSVAIRCLVPSTGICSSLCARTTRGCSSCQGRMRHSSRSASGGPSGDRRRHRGGRRERCTGCR